MSMVWPRRAARSPQHSAHGALHRAIANAVQGLLAGVTDYHASRRFRLRDLAVFDVDQRPWPRSCGWDYEPRLKAGSRPPMNNLGHPSLGGLFSGSDHRTAAELEKRIQAALNERKRTGRDCHVRFVPKADIVAALPK